ncbi:MAG TPA: thioredoxin domain-containing protein [Ideonella sp.]|nr:thioredoxin domain-containing protein [Ideonella sp.]
MDELPLVTEADHLEGARNAAVTLLQYGDFQCPACIQAFSFVHQVRERYRGRLAFVFRHFPLLEVHPQALAAAVAAEVASESGRFWAMHDRLYGLAGELDPASLLAAAQAAGLDPLSFSAQRGELRYAERVAQQRAGGVQARVRATPTFFVNGRLVDTSFGYTALHDAVAQAVGS